MSRPVYTTLDQVKAKLPIEFITQALDDDGDAVIDADVWTAVAEEAADQVDERLGMRYAVPFDPANLSAKVRSSSLMFVLETLYLRRGFGTEETNPFLNSARAARKELTAIGNGDMPLTPEAERPRKSVSTVTEPARSSSKAGNLSS
jgi:hypothetical protein